MGGEVWKPLESTDPLFIHEDEGYNTAVLSDMVRRDVEFDPEAYALTPSEYLMESVSADVAKEEFVPTREESIDSLRQLLEEGVIDKDKYLAELALVPPDAEELALIERMAEADAWLPGNELPWTPLELHVEEMTGMEPDVDRAVFAPWAGRRDEGTLEWAAPGLFYDIAKAFNAPGVAMRGEEVTPEEVFETALDLTWGGLGASALTPRVPGGVDFGMAKVPMGGVKGFNLARSKEQAKIETLEKLKQRQAILTTSLKRRLADEEGYLYSPSRGRYPRAEAVAEISRLNERISQMEGGLSSVMATQRFRSGRTPIDRYMDQLEIEYRRQRRKGEGDTWKGIPPEQWVAFKDKIQTYLERDYGTGGDPLRSGLFTGEIGPGALLNKDWDHVEVSPLYTLLMDENKAAIIAADETARIPIRRKIRAGNTASLTQDELNLWNKPPPERIAAEQAYDEMIKRVQAKTFYESEADILKDYGDVFLYPKIEVTPRDRIIAQGEPEALVTHDAPWGSRDFDNPVKRTFGTDAISEQELIDLGLDPARRYSIRRPGKPLTAAEYLMESDPAFRDVVTYKEPVWAFHDSDIPSETLLHPETLVTLLREGGIDPTQISISSLADMFRVAYKTSPAQRSAELLQQRINALSREVNEEVGKLGRSAAISYNTIDQKITEVFPNVWKEGTEVVLSAYSPRTDIPGSSWLKVTDPSMTYLYGDYMSNSIGGYSPQKTRKDRGYGGFEDARTVIEDGRVEIYSLHKEGAGPRLVVEVLNDIPGLERDINLMGGEASQIKGIKARKRYDSFSGMMEGNRPPQGRDIYALLELFDHLNMPSRNIDWDEFYSTFSDLARESLEVRGPLFAHFANFVKDANARWVKSYDLEEAPDLLLSEDNLSILYNQQAPGFEGIPRMLSQDMMADQTVWKYLESLYNAFRAPQRSTQEEQAIQMLRIEAELPEG